MGFRQSPFPMIEGTTGHKSELASPAKGYKAEAAAHQSGVAGSDYNKKLGSTSTSGKYFKSAGSVEGKYPGA